MRIFALETNLAKMQAGFLAPGEKHLATVFYHPYRFLFKLLRYALVTLVIAAAATALVMYTDFPPGLIVGTWLFVWLCLVPWPLLRAYIDWKYDFLFITSDKIVIVDQSTIVRQTITQMNMENVASVASQTQYLNLFPFGVVRFQLKEGTGSELKLRFIPTCDNVCDTVSDAVTMFQRRSVRGN